MALDFTGVTPNPARDKSVKLPKLNEEEMTPLAAHVEASFYALASKYRLPHLVYDVCGMRLTELERLEWRDVDEQGCRWRVRKEVAKTRRSHWIPFERFPNQEAQLVFEAVSRLVPREDRDPYRRVFSFSGDAYRTELARACKAAGVPLFTPNDLRHRRATLWHLGGVPVADAASWLGHSAGEHLKTYAHATLEERRRDQLCAAPIRARVIAVASSTSILDRRQLSKAERSVRFDVGSNSSSRITSGCRSHRDRTTGAPIAAGP